MGDDEETFSSNINKPSIEQASEKQIIEEKKLNGEEEINNSEQCEFVPKSEDSNVSCEESKEVAVGDKLKSDVVAQEEKEESAVEGGIEGHGDGDGDGDMHKAVAADADVEAKMEAEMVVGGGEKLVAEEGPVTESHTEALEDKVGEEKSDFNSGEQPVMDAEGNVEMMAEENPVSDADSGLGEAVTGGGDNAVPCVVDHGRSGSRTEVEDEEAEGVVEEVDLPVEATLGDEGKDANIVGNELMAAVEEAKEVVDPEDLQVEEANVGDAGKYATMVGNELMAAVEEAKEVVDTEDLQVEEANVGDAGKDANIVGNDLMAAVEGAKEVVDTGDLQVEDANVGDAGKDANIVGNELMAAVEGAKEVVDTRDLRVEDVNVGDAGKDANLVGGESMAAVEEAKEVVDTGDLQVGETTVGDEMKDASVASAQPMAGVEDADEVVETGNIQAEGVTVGYEEKDASVVGVQSVAAVEEAKEVVETGELLVEKATVGDEEKGASIVGVQLVSTVGEAKEVVETGELQVEEAAIGDKEKDPSKIGISSQFDSAESDSVVARSNYMAVEPDKLQSMASESFTFEEGAEVVAMSVESSMGAAEEESLTEGKKAIVDEIVTNEAKVDMEISTKVAEITEGENTTGSHGLQFVDTELPNSVKEEDKERGTSEKESVVGDIEMDDMKEMDDTVRGVSEDNSLVKQMMASQNSVPDVLQFSGQELLIPVSNQENKESISEVGIPTADTQMEKEFVAETETTKAGDVESPGKIDDSLSVLQDEEDEEMVAGEGSILPETELETETDVGDSSKAVGEKRKRGKNSKNLTDSKIGARAQKLMDEDVCFICFDGGDLVLCDRRGCPKAYHPSCVNRDEAFFRSKGKWNCGWHICSICEKNAHYMCYTCPFALCKGCAKDATILCVRGNKGFCETCMRIVKLIENSDEGTNDIDFDDKSSWEYLFKDYYTDLKSKLSLSSVEIAKAKNPWKGSDVSGGKEESPEAPVVTNNIGGSGTDNSAEYPEASKPKRKKGKKRLRPTAKEEDSAVAVVRGGVEGISTPVNTEWASKELLEFVMHMKNGDKSVLSQFDVQALLLEYIKRNKLRDPRRKSQIICDSRLVNLFGKPRVGHFEMLKLLESHFLIKEDAHMDDAHGSVVDTEVNQLEADENAETPTKGVKEKKRKIRKKGDKSGTLSNRYDYAAIDMHNINLIYLRRKLMEDLLEDVDEFQQKVIGTFVRIRIYGNSQKQDLYRLVQVVGTSKAAEPYKVGKRKTDMMLEILNLNKTEIVSIDTISNQDFTEEECKRLRQSIKCGLLNRMTVGDILDKAMEIQAARVNDWLESETLRLSHLRDRASDMGHRKELRECVEKLQILKTPEERLRRLEEIPKIHVDPNMDPSYESEEDDSDADDRQEVFPRATSSGFAKHGRPPISPGRDFSHKDPWNGGNISNKNLFNKKMSTTVEDVSTIQSSDMVNADLRNQGRDRDTEGSNNLVNLSPYTKSDNVGLNSTAPVNLSASHPAKEAENVVKVNETQKTWHYQDPSGKVQGPFSMAQLRKWSNTGYFPADLRIWRTIESQNESILLTDALAGKFHKENSGDSNFIAAGTSGPAHDLSGHSGKTSETLLLPRENTLGERSNSDQHRGAQTFQLGISKGSIAPPAEVPKLSTEKWTRTNLSNLPSPTPKHSNEAGTGEQVGTVIGGAAFPGGIQLPAAALPQHGNFGSVLGSVLNNSREQLMNSLQNDSVVSGTSFSQAPIAEHNIVGPANPLQVNSLSATGEQHALEDHVLHPPAQGNGTHPIQSGNNQNPYIESHGWLGPLSQKMEQSPLIPVPGQTHAYGPWGVITPQAQNTAGNFSNSGPSALPQTEFWAPPAQSNQSNMQTSAVPTVALGTGLVENNSSAPALRSENSNSGWPPVQANPNMGWVGAAPGTTIINSGANVQGLAPGNANSGWVNTTGSLESPIQRQMPGNVNPGWVAPPGNSGVQGMILGDANPGWVAPFGNVGSAVQVPVSGSGWSLPTGNQGAPVQMAPSGNTNQGWGAPPGNQASRGSLAQNDKGYQVGETGFGDSRLKGSQVGDSGYGNSRPWNRQSSFGSRGRGRGPHQQYTTPRDRLCPYNTNGRCVKGSRCNYIHEG